MKHKRWRTTETVQQRARALRKEPTPAERKLWAYLRYDRLGLRFRRQQPIGPFIVDFCCSARRLVIEIDGDSHAVQVEYDKARTTYLRKCGYTVIRFTNEDVHRRFDGVVEETVRCCEELAPTPALPRKEHGGE